MTADPGAATPADTADAKYALVEQLKRAAESVPQMPTARGLFKKAAAALARVEQERDEARRQVDLAEAAAIGWAAEADAELAAERAARERAEADWIAAGARQAERAERAEEALRSIEARCYEGDPRTDWLPAIGRIARAALAANVKEAGADG